MIKKDRSHLVRSKTINKRGVLQTVLINPFKDLEKTKVHKVVSDILKLLGLLKVGNSVTGKKVTVKRLEKDSFEVRSLDGHKLHPGTFTALQAANHIRSLSSDDRYLEKASSHGKARARPGPNLADRVLNLLDRFHTVAGDTSPSPLKEETLDISIELKRKGFAEHARHLVSVLVGKGPKGRTEAVLKGILVASGDELRQLSDKRPIIDQLTTKLGTTVSLLKKAFPKFDTTGHETTADAAVALLDYLKAKHERAKQRAATGKGGGASGVSRAPSTSVKRKKFPLRREEMALLVNRLLDVAGIHGEHAKPYQVMFGDEDETKPLGAIASEGAGGESMTMAGGPRKYSYVLTKEEHAAAQKVKVSVPIDLVLKVRAREPYTFRGYTIERHGNFIDVTFEDGGEWRMPNEIPSAIHTAFRFVKMKLAENKSSEKEPLTTGDVVSKEEVITGEALPEPQVVTVAASGAEMSASVPGSVFDVSSGGKGAERIVKAPNADGTYSWYNLNDAGGISYKVSKDWVQEVFDAGQAVSVGKVDPDALVAFEEKTLPKKNLHIGVAFLETAADVKRAAEALPFRLKNYNFGGRTDAWLEGLAEYPKKTLRGDSLTNIMSASDSDDLLASLTAAGWINREKVDASLSTHAFIGLAHRREGAARYPREFAYTFNHDNPEAMAYVKEIADKRSAEERARASILASAPNTPADILEAMVKYKTRKRGGKRVPEQVASEPVEAQVLAEPAVIPVGEGAITTEPKVPKVVEGRTASKSKVWKREKFEVALTGVEGTDELASKSQDAHRKGVWAIHGTREDGFKISHAPTGASLGTRHATLKEAKEHIDSWAKEDPSRLTLGVDAEHGATGMLAVSGDLKPHAESYQAHQKAAIQRGVERKKAGARKRMHPVKRRVLEVRERADKLKDSPGAKAAFKVPSIVGKQPTFHEGQMQQRLFEAVGDVHRSKPQAALVPSEFASVSMFKTPKPEGGDASTDAALARHGLTYKKGAVVDAKGEVVLRNVSDVQANVLVSDMDDALSREGRRVVLLAAMKAQSFDDLRRAAWGVRQATQALRSHPKSSKFKAAAALRDAEKAEEDILAKLRLLSNAYDGALAKQARKLKELSR